MDLTEGSETSAKLNLTPGENPKEDAQDSEHGETLKSIRKVVYPTIEKMSVVCGKSLWQMKSV
jgi:hypothetical protein